MSCRAGRRQDGVTLVELLVALAIAALVMAPLLTMLGTSVNAGTENDVRLALEQDARFALERIAAEARATPRKTLSPENTALSDSGGWFDKSRFKINADKQLIEVRDGIDNVIAESVTDFGVSAHSVGIDATIVEATLRLERDAEVAQASIAMRLGGPRW